RPLWELWVVEGLEDGRVGFITKIHHCAADGVASAALLANVFDLEPDILDPSPPAEPWIPDKVPTPGQLLLQALAAIVRALLGVPGLLKRTATGVRDVAELRRSPDADSGRLSGNKVSNMFTSVPVNMTDALERLHHVHDVTKGAKEVQNALGAEMLEAWSELTPPAPFAGFMRLYSRSGLASRHRPP